MGAILLTKRAVVRRKYETKALDNVGKSRGAEGSRCMDAGHRDENQHTKKMNLHGRRHNERCKEGGGGTENGDERSKIWEKNKVKLGSICSQETSGA